MRDPTLPGLPGTVVLRSHDAVLVRTGDGGVWVGQVRTATSVKLPATLVLAPHLKGVPERLEPLDDEPADDLGWREVSYRRHGPVGVVSFEFYNGAMSTSQCRRLTAACATPPPRPPGCWWSATPGTCSPTGSI